ncbi:MAG: MBL fold metallo-hydrolase [Deltaproteobacteria bacterium]|jgi:phosphoribosyl 1,2-cyclic phosphodiesterase|nr:MBL fold metallo-hydrolase [Deltaproteobacteria bacterium]
MKLSLLASGSQGNAAVIDNGDTRILIDAGLSAREICRRLDCVGVEIDSIDALLITHEHKDHIRGLGPLIRRHKISVYLHTNVVGRLSDIGQPASVREFTDGITWQLGSLNVKAFSVTHDAAAPVGFLIESREGKVGFVTDLGRVTQLVQQSLQGCRALVIEANHDEKMLREGPYPWALKQRVQSNHGHLSNVAAGRLLDKLLWPGLDAIFLAHLSETNNDPKLAKQAVEKVLSKQNRCLPTVTVGQQNQPTEWLTL